MPITVYNGPLSSYKIGSVQHADGHYQKVTLYDASGNALVMPGTAVGTATESGPTVTNSSGIKVAANASRIGGFLQNLSTTEVLFYSFSGTATTSDFKLGPYQILPFHIDGLLYRGDISMIADDAGPYNIKIVECT